MCVNLHCEKPDGYCSSNDEPAADGTECGNGKVRRKQEPAQKIHSLKWFSLSVIQHKQGSEAASSFKLEILTFFSAVDTWKLLNLLKTCNLIRICPSASVRFPCISFTLW